MLIIFLKQKLNFKKETEAFDGLRSGFICVLLSVGVVYFLVPLPEGMINSFHLEKSWISN
jgi:hypothetical protein